MGICHAKSACNNCLKYLFGLKTWLNQLAKSLAKNNFKKLLQADLFCKYSQFSRTTLWYQNVNLFVNKTRELVSPVCGIFSCIIWFGVFICNIHFLHNDKLIPPFLATSKLKQNFLQCGATPFDLYYLNGSSLIYMSQFIQGYPWGCSTIARSDFIVKGI